MNLADIKTFDQLLPWLSTNLNWPMAEIEIAEETAFDDLTFEYEAKELGLKQDDIAHVREIRQLRPMVTGQPWGIFFVNFDDKKIPVGVLKRILGGLTIKKRQSANKAEQKAWTLHDLLFISASGNSGARELSFLHFAEENGGKNKTVLKELGWDKDDTQAKLDYIERTLRNKLVWPDDASDAEHWRTQWSAAFTTTHGATIKTAKELTKQLAQLASAIRKAAGDVLGYENKNGPLTKIYENFKTTIFHNLTPADFADMYAQTICYGLLAASIQRRSGALVADDAALIAPLTQPFLKDLMETFLAVGGRKNAIDFNELGVNEVVELLQSADMDAVLLDFGNKNPHEDPVLHFYEHFLKDYDSIMREQRGVYYTPLPVVRFIVRSVHEILQKEFGLADGLADITTWGEMIAKHPVMQLPKGVEPTAHFVQILDPATGTGTFLVEVIELIEKYLKTKWEKDGKSEAEILRLWNEYVPTYLLPRLNGFELMMAPYAIAHIKLGMKLHETGYRPKANSPRVRVYLTNTLEEPTGFSGQSTMNFITESLALEATGADEIKAKTPITVVVGNPPYSGISANMNSWIAKQKIEDYKYIEGVHFNERKHWLNDDYVQFTRLSEHYIEKTGQGILGFITNHGYLINPTFRGMRWHLLKTFAKIFVNDLHGNPSRKAAGKIDQNVFDIQQGVAILLGIKSGLKINEDTLGNLYAHDLYGERKEKFNFLNKQSISSLKWIEIDYREPLYLYKQADNDLLSEYHSGSIISQIFPFNVTGILTAADNFIVDFSKDVLRTRLLEFFSTEISENDLKSQFDLGKNYSAWALENKRKGLKFDDNKLVSITFRPFDIRWTYFDGNLLWRWREEVMRNYLLNNVGLISARSNKSGSVDHFFVTKFISEAKTGESSTQSMNYPLFLYDNNNSEIRPNLDAGFASRIAVAVGLAYESGIKVKQAALPLAEFQPEAPKQAAMPLPDPNMGRGDIAKNFGPRDVFDYIYAVLHSPIYRTRYADFLKSDFPRIPLPGNADLFRKMVMLGKQLVALHLLDEKQAKVLVAPETRFIGKGEARIEKSYPQFENGKVMINASCWFEDVTADVWNFHIGGYQVCEKWLKDRAATGGKTPKLGRILTDMDILHYRRITISLRETIRIMTEIDAEIEAHGGFPDAFVKAVDKIK